MAFWVNLVTIETSSFASDNTISLMKGDFATVQLIVSHLDHANIRYTSLHNFTI